ncbi:MAG: hypothetical protein HND47_14940 [Chloroflexi bacterium]|nr:hypothetical protein [Chloroflexota bacterium]
MIDILSKRYYYFLFSLIVIIPGLIFLAVDGLPLSIDFTGGSLLEVQFEAGKNLTTEEIIALYEDAGIDDAQVTATETGSLVIRSSFLTNEVRDPVLTVMNEQTSSRSRSFASTVSDPASGRRWLRARRLPSAWRRWA